MSKFCKISNNKAHKSDLEWLSVGVDRGGTGGRGKQGSTEPACRGVRPGCGSSPADGHVVQAAGVARHRGRPCRGHLEVRGGAGSVADTAVTLLCPAHSQPFLYYLHFHLSMKCSKMFVV